MSTLKATYLQQASSASPNITLDASGNATVGNTLAMGSSFLRNKLINGNFAVAQRGTSFTSTNGANNNDTYNLDRWYVLSDGNDIVDITQATDVPSNGSKYSIGLDVETVNKKFGIAQIIENINCQNLIGNTVSLSFKARVTATTKLDNVKAAIVSWSGTADSGVTSDIISAWNVEGTNPTLTTSLTYENTPANLNVTTSWATYKIANIAVDTASTTNIIVFIWSDVTDTTLGDFLYVTDVQLEVGSVATPYERQIYTDQLAQCQRYYQYWGGSAYYERVASGFWVTSTASEVNVPRISVTMRATPTITYSSVSDWAVSNHNTNYTCTAISIGNSSPSSCSFSLTSATGAAGGSVAIMVANNTTNARLGLNAEL